MMRKLQGVRAGMQSPLGGHPGGSERLRSNTPL